MTVLVHRAVSAAAFALLACEAIAGAALDMGVFR